MFCHLAAAAASFYNKKWSWKNWVVVDNTPFLHCSLLSSYASNQTERSTWRQCVCVWMTNGRKSSPALQMWEEKGEPREQDDANSLSSILVPVLVCLVVSGVCQLGGVDAKPHAATDHILLKSGPWHHFQTTVSSFARSVKESIM